MFALFSIFSLAMVLAVNSQETCGQYGGVCIDSSFCHESVVIKGGLCAEQSQTCCLGANCYNDLGGECIDYCPSSILKHGARANNCPTGTNCCVWL